MKNPEPGSLRLCGALIKLFKLACEKNIPAASKARMNLKNRLLRALDLICEKPVAFPKAETLRRRLIPGAREYTEVFAFIESSVCDAERFAREIERIYAGLVK